MATYKSNPGQQCTLQARKHIAALRRAKPDIIIGNQGYTAYKGITGNEKADEWMKIIVEK